MFQMISMADNKSEQLVNALPTSGRCDYDMA
jgi:hypothetical protein